MARIKTNEDIPAPPRGSRSMNGPARLSKVRPMYSEMYGIPDKLENETRRMRAARIQRSTHRSVQTTKNMKAAGTKLHGYKNTIQQVRARAGNRTTSPPRTGPSSGGGGQSARYNRLTGGLKQHGR